MFPTPVQTHTLPLYDSTMILIRPPQVETRPSLTGLLLPAGERIILFTHTGLHCNKVWKLAWQWLNDNSASAVSYYTARKRIQTKEKWGQVPFQPAIIYFKTMLKFSFSPEPPPPSGLIKSAGSSAAVSHTVLERQPPLLLPGAALWFKALILFKWQQRWAQRWRS